MKAPRQSAPDYLEMSLSRYAERIKDCNLIIENIVRNESNQEILDETLLKHFIMRPMQEMTKFTGSKYIGKPVEVRIKLAVPEVASDTTAAAADSTATAAADSPKPGSESKLFDLIEPRYALDQVYLAQSVREQITEALLLVQNR